MLLIPVDGPLTLVPRKEASRLACGSGMSEAIVLVDEPMDAKAVEEMLRTDKVKHGEHVSEYTPGSKLAIELAAPKNWRLRTEVVFDEDGVAKGLSANRALSDFLGWPADEAPPLRGSAFIVVYAANDYDGSMVVKPVTDAEALKLRVAEGAAHQYRRRWSNDAKTVNALMRSACTSTERTRQFAKIAKEMMTNDGLPLPPFTVQDIVRAVRAACPF